MEMFYVVPFYIDTALRQRGFPALNVQLKYFHSHPLQVLMNTIVFYARKTSIELCVLGTLLVSLYFYNKTTSNSLCNQKYCPHTCCLHKHYKPIRNRDATESSRHIGHALRP